MGDMQADMLTDMQAGKAVQGTHMAGSLNDSCECWLIKVQTRFLNENDIGLINSLTGFYYIVNSISHYFVKYMQTC